jgi:hypothetical protein
MPSNHRPQAGLGTVGVIFAFIGLGVVFLIIFFLSNSGRPTNQNNNGQQNQQAQASQDTATSTSEPLFIRIPENSRIYKNTTYNLMFAYPDSFGELTTTDSATTSIDSVIYRAESAVAVKKPVGIGTAFLSGSLGVYLYKKDSFKITINNSRTFVAPAKTGNDTTWKVVDKGTTSQDISIGDSYQAKTLKSQTGIPVFDFTLKTSSSSVLGRFVFELKDYYALIAMPNVSKTDGTPLTDNDISAYNIIGYNMAKTVRVPPAKSSSSSSSSTSSSSTSSNSSSSSSCSNSSSGTTQACSANHGQ